MELVIIGHILSDFFIQTDKIAEKKKKSIWYMILHCVIYIVVMLIILAVLTENFFEGLKIAVIIGLAHVFIDIIKVKIDLKFPKYEHIVFLLDQVVHIIFIILICYLFKYSIDFDKYSSIQLFNDISLHKVFVVFIAGLICSKPTAIFIALIFNVIPKTIEDADNEEDNNEKEKELKNNNNPKEVNVANKDSEDQKEIIKIGMWIGILEREIILMLGLLGQYGAIGFVLAAKSLARYKQLENKAFAEKYLVGTLLSTLIAIVCIAISSFV